MNIIRTTAVELASIPAIAYKQKLASGGAGLRMLRLDQDVSAVFTIDRRSGEATPYGDYDQELFPSVAVAEAQELTHGLPYTARGKFRITVFEERDNTDDVLETEVEKVDMVTSPEYEALIERFSDEQGKLNYALMNKDFMHFASKSTVVGQMIADRAHTDDIVAYIVTSRAAFFSGKKESLTPDEVEGLLETLDEINPRSAFKELSLYIRRIQAKTGDKRSGR